MLGVLVRVGKEEGWGGGGGLKRDLAGMEGLPWKKKITYGDVDTRYVD